MKKQMAASQLNNRIDHTSNLDIETESTFLRLSSIICTIGPASRDVPTLEAMLDAGMNIARLNFSHGTHDYHLETIRNIRQAVRNYSKKVGIEWPLGIALDTKGAEIRAGKLPQGEVVLKKGNRITLTNDQKYKEKSDVNTLYVGYDDLSKICTVGNNILLDDSAISLQCIEVNANSAVCLIENTATLGSSKGVNFPGVEVDRPYLPTDQDISDIKFAIDNELDMIFASFVSNARAVREIRKVLGEKGKDIWVVAKVENNQGVKNLTEIIAEADGIMVERGDLGSEIPTEKVFLAQKAIIAQCNRYGRPVICATQLLESMTDKPRPTRAESADTANAILDGADCVMLSGETAKGSYPVECVSTMAAICREAESALWQMALFNDLLTCIKPPIHVTDATAISAVEASLKCEAKAIIVLTVTGRSAKLIAKYRPKCPIIAITTSMRVARQLHLYRGVMPLYYPVKLTPENFLADLQDHVDVGVRAGKSRGFLMNGDSIVTVTGWREGSGYTNTIHISKIE